MTRYREDRHVVQPRVVQTGEQMRCAGAGGGDAHAQFAGELCVRRGHEGSHFFVPDLNEFDRRTGSVFSFFRRRLRAAECAEHAVDAVAGIAVNAANAPGMQSLDDEVADGLSH